MKRFLFSLLIGLLSNLIFAQDIIIKQNGDEIKSKILEITSETIKYKEFEFQDGPTRNINISDVFMVIYENGKREKFTTTESPTPKKDTKESRTPKEDTKESPTPKKDTKNEVSNNNYQGNYFMLGGGVW